MNLLTLDKVVLGFSCGLWTMQASNYWVKVDLLAVPPSLLVAIVLPIWASVDV
jgi:hypothetical protein